MLVNTGDGKGKSTAAFGVVMRAVAGLEVAVVQFLKSGDVARGEEDIAGSSASTGGRWAKASRGTRRTSPNDRRRAPTLGHTRGRDQGRRPPLVVLDEITYPMNWGWIDVDEVVATLPTDRRT